MEGKRFIGSGNDAFRCLRCGISVGPLRNGSFRNHCPACLWSLHVDRAPGDRAERCGGLMEPVGVERTGKKGWIIVHRCTSCGEVRRNKAATDDPDEPDSWDAIVRLANRAGDGRTGRN